MLNRMGRRYYEQKGTQISVDAFQLTATPSISNTVTSECRHALGVWQDSGSRVSNSFEIKPDPSPHGKELARLMAQRE